MPEVSAGLLMCRKKNSDVEFFLVHPGGPYYTKKNEGAWSIPKGLPNKNEELLETAKREFFEETGITPLPPFHSLDFVKLKSGKVIHAWAFIGDWNPTDEIVCNKFDLEWPPHSGKFIKVPEVDRAEWMTFEKASVMINPRQVSLLERAKEIYS